MSFTSLTTTEPKPDQLVSKGQKGEDYHRRMGRWCIGEADTGRIQRMQSKMIIAERAYNDNIMQEEDLDSYLADESGFSRNRVWFNFNMMRTLVEQYRGTMVQTRFSASVQPVSRMVETRRQADLGHHMLMHSIAETSQNMRHIVSQHYQIGETLQQTMGYRENAYQDPYIRAMNHLLERQVAINADGEKRADDAMRFAFSGILACRFQREGSFIREHRIHPRDFFWDTSADELDFSDAFFMGACPMMSMPEIATYYDVDKDYLKYIEETIRHHSGLMGLGGRSSTTGGPKIKVFALTFKDVSYAKVGYINGAGGLPTLVAVGYSEAGEEPKFTLNDLIDPPDTPENDDLFGDKRHRDTTLQVSREVDMVPWEYMLSGSGKLFEQQPKDLPDLVLKHGLCTLQEYDPRSPDRSALPIKAQAYAMADKEIITPLQSAIDPNRFMIRVLGSVESQISMAGTKFSGIDLDLIDQGTSPDDAEIIAKRGGMLHFRNNGRGIQNAVASWDNSPGQGTYALMQVVQTTENLIRTVMGIHAPMTGERPERNQAVGVTSMLIERGSLMQEPFFDGYHMWQIQKYRFYATAGKEYYMERPDILADLVDKEEILALLMSEEAAMERLNTHVVRDDPNTRKRDISNEWLNYLVQVGLIDRKIYLNLYNQVDIDEALQRIKQYTAELEQAEMEAARQERQEATMTGMQAMQQGLDAEKQDIYKDQMKSADMLAREGAKEKANMTREQVKAELAPPPKQPTAKA